MAIIYIMGNKEDMLTRWLAKSSIVIGGISHIWPGGEYYGDGQGIYGAYR